MKIKVVKDKSGKVVATIEPATGTGATVEPVLSDGEKVEEVEVADNYRENLAALYK
jgi:hypothetical protein